MYLVELGKLEEELLRLKEEKGFAIGETLWMLAQAIKLAKRLGL